jgi:processive 1,2-diacylglycerol beta-glucosyltransferase
MARRFISWVQALEPDVAVATHFFPADVLDAARRTGKLRSGLIVAITDLFPHRVWLVPRASAFVLGSPQTKALCQHRGVEEARLHVLGIPVGAKFAEPADRAQLARQLGLDPSRRTMLIAGGGMGVGPIGELVRQFVSLETTRPCQVQLLVVCGHARKLRQRLERMRAVSAMPMRVFGFVETMHELMRVSDLLVTKAGGLTVMEALSVGLPMIFCGTIPGQERLNAEYVIQHAGGVNAREPSAVTSIVLRLLDDPTQLEAMRANARALGRPHAAQELVERLIIPHARRAE